jgi:hypothetical protein
MRNPVFEDYSANKVLSGIFKALRALGAHSDRPIASGAARRTPRNRIVQLPNLHPRHYPAPLDVASHVTARTFPPMRSAFAVCLARWKRFSPLARDVTFVLVLKAAALCLLWWAFFSSPTARHMNVPVDDVADRLLSVPQAESSRFPDALR